MLCRKENSVQIARLVILGADQRSRLRHVLQPETTKRNDRNERNETAETSQTMENTEAKQGMIPLIK